MNDPYQYVAYFFLYCLDLKRSDIPRFRGAYLENGNIIIRARIGAENRELYKEYINILQSNEHYIRDHDDDFDSTFAYFYFKFPDYDKEALEKIQPYYDGEEE